MATKNCGQKIAQIWIKSHRRSTNMNDTNKKKNIFAAWVIEVVKWVFMTFHDYSWLFRTIQYSNLSMYIWLVYSIHLYYIYITYIFFMKIIVLPSVPQPHRQKLYTSAAEVTNRWGVSASLVVQAGNLPVIPLCCLVNGDSYNRLMTFSLYLYNLVVFHPQSNPTKPRVLITA